MNNLTQNRGRTRGVGIRGRIAGIAMALATVLISAVFAPESAKAQAEVLTQTQAYSESVLHSFIGVPDGADPEAALMMDPHGNLYGTTLEGGTTDDGTVFKVTPAGQETVLYSFTGGANGDPYAGLVRDALGNLYGTTYGVNSVDNGTVFKLGANGQESLLYHFAGDADGANPYAALVRDSWGNLYGTTLFGGEGAGCFNGCGTVFEVNTHGTETVLHAFSGTGGDGSLPYSGLVRDAQGDLYGTTETGGASGFGTVFKLNKAGVEIVLHSFAGGSDGANPYAGLVQDSLGNLYGVTEFGGTSGDGTVFEINTAGKEKVLYSFAGGSDGANPIYASLVLDTQGDLYGTTAYGGGDTTACTNGCGTVFKVDTHGRETVLYRFSGSKGDGAHPVAGLVRDAQGNLYGTTSEGGTAGMGAVFKLKPEKVYP
ncbi:MAG TPA: choice-of-anchor tandem repeat GloVer-containing protein [Candidatus Acidoferrales bacterium]